MYAIRSYYDDLKCCLIAFSDRACLGLDDLPKARGIPPFRINTGDSKPVRVKMRPVPFHARDILEKELNELNTIGAIREVAESEYGAPLRLVEKPDGSLRICIDYRSLNLQTMVPQYPLPRLEDLVAGVRGKPYMAAMDLTKAYWQLPVAEEDQHKTTFTCDRGNFEFLRVPMGISYNFV